METFGKEEGLSREKKMIWGLADLTGRNDPSE